MGSWRGELATEGRVLLGGEGAVLVLPLILSLARRPLREWARGGSQQTNAPSQFLLTSYHNPDTLAAAQLLLVRLCTAPDHALLLQFHLALVPVSPRSWVSSRSTSFQSSSNAVSPQSQD